MTQSKSERRGFNFRNPSEKIHKILKQVDQFHCNMFGNYFKDYPSTHSVIINESNYLKYTKKGQNNQMQSDQQILYKTKRNFVENNNNFNHDQQYSQDKINEQLQCRDNNSKQIEDQQYSVQKLLKHDIQTICQSQIRKGGFNFINSKQKVEGKMQNTQKIINNIHQSTVLLTASSQFYKKQQQQQQSSQINMNNQSVHSSEMNNSYFLPFSTHNQILQNTCNNLDSENIKKVIDESQLNTTATGLDDTTQGFHSNNTSLILTSNNNNNNSNINNNNVSSCNSLREGKQQSIRGFNFMRNNNNKLTNKNNNNTSTYNINKNSQIYQQ